MTWYVHSSTLVLYAYYLWTEPLCVCTYVCVLFVDKKPEEEDLWRHIIEHVGKNWRALLTYLGVPSTVMDEEEMSNRGNVKQAFFKALLWWHRGNSQAHPSTWEELLQALENVGFKDRADCLRWKLLSGEISSEYSILLDMF